MVDGKKFESNFREACEKVDGTLVYRLPDQQSGRKGSSNPCDFLVYNMPYLWAVECKSHEGNTFPFSCITANQFGSLLEFSKNKCVSVVCLWWKDYDEVWIIPITVIQKLAEYGYKSLNHSKMKDWAIYVNVPCTVPRKYPVLDMTRPISLGGILYNVQRNPTNYVKKYNSIEYKK